MYGVTVLWDIAWIEYFRVEKIMFSRTRDTRQFKIQGNMPLQFVNKRLYMINFDLFFQSSLLDSYSLANYTSTLGGTRKRIQFQSKKTSYSLINANYTK